MKLVKIKINLVVMCISMLTCSPIFSKPIITAICQEPTGPRIDYGGILAQENGKELYFSNDSISGISPIFIIDDDKKDIMTYIINNAKYTEKLGIEQKQARNAIVILNTADMITAIDRTEDTVGVFSLYPKAGLGFFTYHEANTLSGAKAHSVTFVAKCSFAK